MGYRELVVGLLVLGASGACADADLIYKKGWSDAIECVERHRSPEYCREPERTDEPYLSGWRQAISCMEEQASLKRCRDAPAR
jgi:hypothetical protein